MTIPQSAGEGVVHKRGRITRKLAEKLQRAFPNRSIEIDGVVHVEQLVWLPENLYPATGAYRTNPELDCWRWEGYATGERADGTGATYTVMKVGSYTPMSKLSKASVLRIGPGGEVTGG